MSAVEMIVQSIGFDPTQLAGRPTGFTMFYLQGMSLAAVIASFVITATPLHRIAKVETLCVVGMLVSLAWVTVAQQTLFVEYPGVTTIAPDTKIAEPYIVPIPMPGLRSKNFDAWSVGTPNYRNAQPSAYDEESRKPENAVGRFATIALHWLGLVLFSSCLLAGSGLGIKALIAQAVKRLRPR